MITIKDLIVSYNKKDKVIDCLNIAFAHNTIHGIVGMNGAGKTSLLNAIYGLIKVQSGEIKCDDLKINKKKISFLATENFYYSNITGNEYLSLFKNMQFETNKWNELFMLPLDKIIDSYSTGMKKKMPLFGILKQDKSIMILDEPFNELDIETCRIIRSILLRLKERKKTIIITSHIIETLTNLCDYIHYLEKGKFKYSRDKSEFKEFEHDIFNSIENKNKKLISELIE